MKSQYPSLLLLSNFKIKIQNFLHLFFNCKIWIELILFFCNIFLIIRTTVPGNKLKCVIQKGKNKPCSEERLWSIWISYDSVQKKFSTLSYCKHVILLQSWPSNYKNSS